jgi:ABC-type transport system involved in cytochrome c biogenesis permease subunit
MKAILRWIPAPIVALVSFCFHLIARRFTITVVVAAALYLAWAATMPKDRPGEMRLQQVARFPVQEGGRVKPRDTLARNCLQIVSGRQSFRDDQGVTQPVIRWLLDVESSLPGEADSPALKHPVFRIENLQVLDFLGLEPRSGLRYSLDEFKSKIDELAKEASRARAVDEAKQDLFDHKLIELAQHVKLYIQLATGEMPQMLPVANGEWLPISDVNEAIMFKALDIVLEGAGQKRMINVAQMKPDQRKELLRRFKEVLLKLDPQPRAQLFDQARSDVSPPPLVGIYEDLIQSYQAGKVDDFNKAVDAYQKQIDQLPSSIQTKAGLEYFFNHFDPFHQCMILYVVVFLLSCIGWLVWGAPLARAAFWLAVLTLAVHTAALVTRMFLQGYPPVTNLYSSAIFIGWGAVMLGLGLEIIYGNSIGTAVASVLGFLTVWISGHLAGDGDTLEMMRAVLDTQFWLALHVTCVTFGYTATFVAGGLAVTFILLGVCAPMLDRDIFKTLGQMIYGVLCFATLLSFTGTVLGGLWADVSWGRFWGWDPKENGALLIVIWNALILHARWGGMVKQRGVAVLAVIGNMITAWSWFGTNQLGVGLHAYGFSNKLAFGLTVFWATQLLVIFAGLLPLKAWNSANWVAQSPKAPVLPPFSRRDGSVRATSPS